MRFDIITLFPELFGPHLTQGVTRRAFAGTGPVAPKLEVKLWPLREHASDTYRRVDDRPFGGGPGMVMLAESLLRALDAVQADRAAGAHANDFVSSTVANDSVAAAALASPALPAVRAAPGPLSSPQAPTMVVHFTPTGRRIDQTVVQEFASGPGAVLVCGRYEGIDQRFIDARVTHELSLGDFVLSGGELPALALLDAVARLQDGVLTEGSHLQDSFSDGLLEGPHYSRPERLQCDGREQAVPPVLLSGHHAGIAQWRRQQALRRTAQRRPELIAAARAAGRLSAADEAFLLAL